MDDIQQIPLETLRHSAAHILASAVLQKYPGAKLGVGPVIENGFYYDIDSPTPISEHDLKDLEDRMQAIIKAKLPFTREEMSLEAAKKLFTSLGQDYKVELLNDLEEHGTTKVDQESLAAAEKGGVHSISIYRTGDFVDLCQGPHVENTSQVRVFKLSSLAGAYWRGSEKNPMLTRIYGLAFYTKEDLKNYLDARKEAERRDHRKIGKEQELFMFDDLAGKGLPLWLPNGTIIRDEIQAYAVSQEHACGYERVVTPVLGKEELYLTSGHLPYYKEDMYPSMKMDDGTYYLKGMNCPHHHLIYRHKPRSYRELPVRFAEYGMCHRNELSGTLAGLLRVRQLTMNDAHIYCRKDQIKDEFKAVVTMTQDYFKTFGLTDYWFRLSKWDSKKLEKYINQPENWNYCEGVLREVLQEMNVQFVEADDEAAFYGPKVDVQFKSVIGRTETMSTVQLDFLAHERFGLEYTDQDGNSNQEVFVIHRAPLSTHERFTAFLIEHYAGEWPLWLAPTQVSVIPVSDTHLDACNTLAQELSAAGIRVKVDAANETVGNKIRKSEKQRVPRMIVIGDKEADLVTLAVRSRGNKESESVAKEAFLETLQNDIKNRVI